MALSDYVAIVNDKLRDTAGKISALARQTAIGEAVKEYSIVRPRRRVQTVTGDGSAFLFDLATDFEEGFSSLSAIEHPVDQQEPQYLDADDYVLTRAPATGLLQLRLRSLVLEVSGLAYVQYTARHVMNDNAGGDTIILADRDAVASLATAICARQLATYYAQTSDPTLGADVATFQTRWSNYLQLAKDLEGVYRAHLGITDESPTAGASAIGDLDVAMADGEGDRMFHSRRFR